MRTNAAEEAGEEDGPNTGVDGPEVDDALGPLLRPAPPLNDTTSAGEVTPDVVVLRDDEVGNPVEIVAGRGGGGGAIVGAVASSGTSLGSPDSGDVSGGSDPPTTTPISPFVERSEACEGIPRAAPTKEPTAGLMGCAAPEVVPGACRTAETDPLGGCATEEFTCPAEADDTVTVAGSGRAAP